MAGNRLLRLKEDADGALWISSENGGVTRYAQGAFKTFTTQDGLPHNRVSRIQPDGRGGLQFQTRDGYAYWRDGKLLPDPEKLDPGKTRKFFAPSGAVWTLDEMNHHYVPGRFGCFVRLAELAHGCQPGGHARSSQRRLCHSQFDDEPRLRDGRPDRLDDQR